MGTYYPDQPRWLEWARTHRPNLSRRRLAPTRAVTIRPDPAAFQGWAAADAGPWPETKTLTIGDTIVADFGALTVGRPTFRIEQDDRPNDAPVRLRITLAEVPLELGETLPDVKTMVSPAWLQEEVVLIDELPATVTLPRRASFRYARIHWDESVFRWNIRLTDLAVDEESAVPAAFEPILERFDAPERPLVEASLRTLRNCMQAVFEDGPKRDRRLWLGDLRLQTLANYATFRDFHLVRRSLMLLAGLCDGEGRIPACVFDFAEPAANGTYIVDYAALFGAVLDDFLQAGGDRDTVTALFPVAFRQLEWIVDRMDASARYGGKEWCFIDWKDGLEREAALAGVVVYSLRRTAGLADTLKRPEEAERLRSWAEPLADAARNNGFDPSGGIAVSGASRQVSYATWAWWTLAGIWSPVKAAAAFRNLARHPDAVLPGGPYLMHHVVDALCACGMPDEAVRRLRAYWGEMLAAGLDTFPEVWDAADPRRSPYGSALLNSYCHAWSCTPPWLLARIKQTMET